MSVARVTELSCTSTNSFEDAIREGIDRANEDAARRPWGVGQGAARERRSRRRDRVPGQHPRDLRPRGLGTDAAGGRSPADHSARPMRPPARVNSFRYVGLLDSLADHRGVQRLLAARWLRSDRARRRRRQGRRPRGTALAGAPRSSRRGGRRARPTGRRSPASASRAAQASTRALALVRPWRPPPAWPVRVPAEPRSSRQLPPGRPAAPRSPRSARAPGRWRGRPDSRLRAPHRFAPRPTAGPGRPAACRPRRRAA